MPGCSRPSEMLAVRYKTIHFNWARLVGLRLFSKDWGTQYQFRKKDIMLQHTETLKNDCFVIKVAHVDVGM